LNEPPHHPGNPNADSEFLAEVSRGALDAGPGSAAPPLSHHRDRVDRITDLADHGRDHLLGLPLQRLPHRRGTQLDRAAIVRASNTFDQA
jgi:hypothetical protein